METLFGEFRNTVSDGELLGLDSVRGPRKYGVDCSNRVTRVFTLDVCYNSEVIHVDDGIHDLDVAE